MCKDILMQMVDFSLKAVEYRELTEGYTLYELNQ